MADDGKTQAVIKTIWGIGYRFVAEVAAEPAGERDHGPAPAARRHDDRADDELTPRIRFVPVSGGMTLAMGETGDGPCLVKAATWLTQIDTDTGDNPIWGHWVRALSRRFRYVRYDPRGCGLSDRDLGGRT